MKTEASHIINKLYNKLSLNYYPIIPNSYLYNWESDLLAVDNESMYITEYEIKVSRSDFRADFKKVKKHELIKDGFELKCNFKSIPNYFYYATPPGLIDRSEIPKYAGLIELGIGNRIVKKAPKIHDFEITDEKITELINKTYYKYWNLVLQKYKDDDS